MPNTSKPKKPLTVYATGGDWHDERNQTRHQQARFVCASPSKAAIYRQYPALKNAEWNETWNEQEVEAALSKPLALFARGLTDWKSPYFEVLDFEKSVRR